MATIVYLDADDEITSAATRIRTADDRRVAIVIPFGSRVATSRINFRLLAREAQANGRRLDVIAPDASARALAASAGLAVFGSVAEYEDALDAPAGPGTAAPGPVVAPAAAPAPGPAGPEGPSAGAPGAAQRAGAGAIAATRDPEPVAEDPRAVAAREAELDAIIHRGREVPVARGPRRGPGRGLVAGLVLLAAALVAGAAAAVTYLPSAEITITPRVQAVGPIELTVTADPAATAVDEAARVIPAKVVSLPVAVSGEFPATGRRVERTAATGGVRWRNCDNSDAYTIPAGTIVRTRDGIEFSLDEAVFLPVATVSGTGSSLSLECQTSEVAVTAVKPGPDGNVAAGAIAVIPARYNRNLLSVVNPRPTTGGTRTEFTRVSQGDVDAALASLTTDLAAQLEVVLADPPGVPDGATVFPDTATLGDPVPTEDPAALVGREVPAFTLGLAATGTVLAVDASPVEAIAAGALEAAVDDGSELVAGSMRVAVGEGVVAGDRVAIPVAGSARQVRPVDGEALRREVMGLPLDRARERLAPYGTVDITTWPELVTTIPTVDQRVSLTVLPAVDELPDTDPVPGTPGPAAAPQGSPSDGADPSQPLPSG